jgi:hypothetical protein
MKKTVSATDLIEDSNPSPILRKMEKDNQQLRRKIDELRLELGKNDSFIEMMKRELRAIDVLPPVPIKSMSKTTRVSAPLSAVLVLGDWHIGEYTESDQIEQFNQYSWNIAQKRAYYLQKQFVNWVNVQRTATMVDELVVIAIGDMLSGDIHQELQVTNEFPAPVQTVRAGILLAKTIAEMSSHFKKVRVEYVTQDNHSRLTQKPQWKEGGLNSYNYIIGWIVQQQLAKLSNVEVNTYNCVKALVDVRGWKYLCMHGHNIKGWAGIPWYGADRQIAREAKVRRQRPTKNFDKVIIGHFHQPLWTTDYIVNGSMSGTNELDHGLGRDAAPCQVAFLVHPKYGEMNRIEFNVANGDDEDFGGAELVLEEK